MCEVFSRNVSVPKDFFTIYVVRSEEEFLNREFCNKMLKKKQY